MHGPVVAAGEKGSPIRGEGDGIDSIADLERPRLFRGVAEVVQIPQGDATLAPAGKPAAGGIRRQRDKVTVGPVQGVSAMVLAAPIPVKDMIVRSTEHAGSGVQQAPPGEAEVPGVLRQWCREGS